MRAIHNKFTSSTKEFECEDALVLVGVLLCKGDMGADSSSLAFAMLLERHWCLILLTCSSLVIDALV